MQSLEDRVRELERTVQHLADQLELYRLTASYAPSVDSGSVDRTANLWIEEGVFHTDLTQFNGRAQIANMVNEARSVISKGAAHVISMPHLTIKGDAAVGVCHSRLYLKDGDGFRQWRVAANRWDYVRTSLGWRIQRRVNRLLDGSPESRELFASALDGH